MDKGPERLHPDPAHSPETRDSLSSAFPFAEVINHYKNAPFMEKASMWFLGLGVADGLQIVINRFILNPDPLSGTIEGVSDLGMVLAADNLRSSPLKKLAFIEGIMGGVGSALIKTGNPDLFLPALILAGASGILGVVHFVSGHEPLSKSILDESTIEVSIPPPILINPWRRLAEAMQEEERGKPK